MSGAEWLRVVVIPVGLSLLGSSVLVALVQWRAMLPKTKAEAANLEQQTRSGASDDQLETIDRLSTELKRLAERVERLEGRNDALESRNISLRSALLALTAWVQSVWVVLTPDQRAAVGTPPTIDLTT